MLYVLEDRASFKRKTAHTFAHDALVRPSNSPGLTFGLGFGLDLTTILYNVEGDRDNCWLYPRDGMDAWHKMSGTGGCYMRVANMSAKAL